MRPPMNRDLRDAWRQLWARPTFTIVAATTLALGIGANTAIFSVVQGVLLRPLPYPEPSTLVALGGAFPGEDEHADSNFSHPDFVDLMASSSGIREAAVWSNAWGLALEQSDGATRLPANFVGRRYFDILGARAYRGRLLDERDHDTDGAAVAVLAEAAWHRQFGGDPSIVGRELRLNGRGVTIVGVVSQAFVDVSMRQSAPPDLWLPIEQAPGLVGQIDLRNRSSRLLWAIGRLAPGASAEIARAEARTVATRLAEAYPATNAGFGLTAQALDQTFFGEIRRPLWLLMAGALFVLFICCTNVAGLLLVRASGRLREIAIRRAIGASTSALVRQLLVESVLLSLLGAGLGVMIAAWVTPALVTYSGVELPPHVTVGLDAEILTWCLAVATLVGALVGLVPAWRAGSADVRSVLLASGTPQVARPSRAGAWLVCVQSAAALVLVSGALLMLESFTAMTRTDLGFSSDRLVTFRIDLPAERYGTPGARALFAAATLERLRSEPGVSDALVWGPSMFGRSTWVSLVAPEGRAIEGQNDLVMVWRHSVNPGALSTLGIPLQSGRDLSTTDTASAPLVTIVSQSIAARLWPGGDPVGRRLMSRASDGTLTPIQVVGVAADARHRGRFRFRGGAWGHQPQLDIYLPFAQRANPIVTFGVRERTSSAITAAALRAAIADVDPTLPAHDIAPLADRLQAEEGGVRFAALLMNIYGALALLLAALGVYGVLAFSVASRRHELGIRMALGAAPRRVIRSIVRQGMMVVMTGGVIGLIVLWTMKPTIDALLFGISTTNPRTLVSAIGLLVGAAALACYLPARRATRVDLTQALKTE